MFTMNCHAFGCDNKIGGGPRKPGISFHKFPKNEQLKKFWEQAVGGENWTAPQGAILCSAHFEPEEFDKSGKLIRLRKCAIPSLFSHLKKDDNLDQFKYENIIDLDDNSNSKFCTSEASLVEDMNNCDTTDSLTDDDTPLTERIAKAMKKLTENSNMKFMENFDPEKSNRERRKLTRKINSAGKKMAAVYDDTGCLIASRKDVCDCMDVKCPGCHFPCPRCYSPKCGHECRVNRKWTYEYIEIEGTEKFLTLNEDLLKNN